jgi:Tol biopolymer transport system component
MYLATGKGAEPQSLMGCSDEGCPSDPAWSSDGSTLAFALGDAFGGDIFVTVPGDDQAVKATTGPWLDSSPSWRPTEP